MLWQAGGGAAGGAAGGWSPDVDGVADHMVPVQVTRAAGGGGGPSVAAFVIQQSGHGVAKKTAPLSRRSGRQVGWRGFVSAGCLWLFGLV